MQSKLKLIITVFSFIITINIFSGCIFDDIATFGIDFNEKSTSIQEYEGFPVLFIDFETNSKINLKTYSSNSNLIDEEFFFGSGNATMNIGSYRETVSDKKITLEVSDDNNNLISENTFSLDGSSLDIVSFTAHTWENYGKTSLFELDFYIDNSGDVPVFPHKLRLNYNNSVYNGLFYPVTILSGSNNKCSSFIYVENIKLGDSFDLEILDIDNNILITKELKFDKFESVNNTIYQKGVDNFLTVPIPPSLNNYYQDHERYFVDDYTSFIFNPYDDLFMDFFLDLLIKNLDFSSYFNMYSDPEKINKIGDFIQKLDYIPDYNGSSEIEYPKFPVETLFGNDFLGGGDCEDKAILAASLLINDDLGYDTSLIRIPNHMAVGVNLDASDISKYDYYVDDYYFLDTSPGPRGQSDLGYVHNDYQNPSEIEVYKLNSKSIIDHYWEKGSMTIFTDTNQKKTIKLIVYVRNLGNKTAEDLELKAVFYTPLGLEVEQKIFDIPDVEAFSKIKKMICLEVPSGIECKFDTRIYKNGEKVSKKTSEGTLFSE